MIAKKRRVSKNLVDAATPKKTAVMSKKADLRERHVSQIMDPQRSAYVTGSVNMYINKRKDEGKVPPGLFKKPDGTTTVFKKKKK